MDPDPDPGGPKTYGPDGSGFGSGPDGSGFGSGSAILHLSLAQRWFNSLHSLHKDVVWVSVHILHPAAFWVFKYNYMKLLCVHLAWSCCQTLVQLTLSSCQSLNILVQLAWSCRQSINICTEHLAWSCHQRRWTWTGDFKCREVKTGFCRNRSMQTGSSGTLIGWKSGQTTFVPLWDWMEGAWLRTQQRIYESLPRPFARTNPARGFTTPHLLMSAELL
jgi:hypothetical protein